MKRILCLPVLAIAMVAPASSASPEAGARSFEPLQGEWIERLELPGGRMAYVTPPLGATGPRPVVVAVHGAIDDPGLMCSAWRIVTDVYPFVLCPAGSRVRKDTYVWPSSEAIDTSVDAALEALRARYGERVAAGPALYVAFSQGANLAGPVLGRGNRGRFARAVLTEGGYRAFETGDDARAFVASGGERVLYTCSQPGCASWFGASQLPKDRTKVVYAGAHGHSMVPAVRQSIHEALPWVVEGLAGWKTYADAPKLASH